MGVIEKLRQLALENAGDAVITDIRVGLRYSAVMLDSGRVGIAYSFMKQNKGKGILNHEVKSLVGKRASDVAVLVGSADLTISSIGLATSNALFNTDSTQYLRGDILSHIELRPSDTVAMVGHFAPLVPAIKARVGDLKIFEQISEPAEGILPASEAPKWLGKCQVVLITATSIVNNTIDMLLEACVDCREVAIVGPSTPMAPEAFHGTAVTLLSGIVVKEGSEIMQIVSKGGGTRSFRDYSYKVNLRVG